MNRHVVFICNTAYQLLTAVQLRITAYASDNVDLILSNQFTNSDRIAENVRKSGLFGDVLFVENKKQIFKSRIQETIYDIRAIRNIRRKIGHADELCLSNISVFSILFLRIYQRKLPDCSIFEDGFITYSKAFVRMDRASIISRILLPKGVLGIASKLWLFSPAQLDWHNDSVEVCRIEPIDRNDKTVIGVLNNIFGYDSADRYDSKYLFMEESFFADGYPIDDLSIVSRLSDVVGKQNLMVKLHPRNSINRFQELGIKTNTEFSTPWELIVLNQDIQNSTLITISSSSILQPFLIFGLQVKSYALLKTLPERPGNMKGDLGDYMESLFGRFPEVCTCPDTIEGFYRMLER